MKNKHLLVISDVYTYGGLETHIYGEFRVLKQLGYKIYFVTGKEFVEENLPKAWCEQVYTGLSFSFSSTAQEILSSRDFLIDLIRKHTIDIVHCHPFAGLFPAFIAAQETRRPFVYSLHGPGSLDVPFGQLYEFVLKSVVLPASSVVHCVSHETQILAKQFAPYRTLLGANGIDLSRFTATDVPNPSASISKCCIVSRIDVFKLPSVQLFIEQALAAGCRQVDVIGDGAERETLMNWVNTIDNQDATVNVLGFRNDVDELLKGYDLVAGMGRVVLEAAASNVPVVLAGYDGIKGVVDEALLAKASFWNNSGRGLANITADAFTAQLQDCNSNRNKYHLRQWVQQYANEDTIWTNFSDHLQTAVFHPADFIPDLVNYLRLAGQNATPLLSDADFLRSIRDVLLGEKYVLSRHYQFMSELDRRTNLSTLINHSNGHFGNVFKIAAEFDARFTAYDHQQQSHQQLLFEQVQQISSGLQATNNTLQATLHDLQVQIQERQQLQSEKEQLIAERARLTAERQQLSVLTEKLEQEIQLVKEQVSHWQAEYNALDAVLQEKEKALLLAETNNSHLTEQQNAVTELLNRKNEEVEALQQQIEWYQKKYRGSYISRIFSRNK